MGLCLIPKISEIVAQRKHISELYDALLKGTKGISRPVIRPNTNYNYAYYPILLESEEHLKAVRNTLNSHEINPRRYFYPSLTTLPYVNSYPKADLSTPISIDASSRVLCLPLYPDLRDDQVHLIASLVKDALGPQAIKNCAGNQ
jgi:dTDP-4-amino-4,6-dideoxygalactose transaminase